jgi:hypothetical protein
MGVVRQLALIVLAISLLTFILLFGALPRLRKTPIGALHRILRHTVPRLLRFLDQRFLNGALTPLLLRAGHYLLHQPHPLVLIFYLVLVTAGIGLFLRSGFYQLTVRAQLLAALTIPLPYVSLYLAATSNPGKITEKNVASALRMYPYDNVLFSPRTCRTCNLQKPARSKHCSLCKACVARHDHHCVWINNCVGLGNIRYFLFFLLSTDALLAVGAWLSYGILDAVVERSGARGALGGGWSEWATFLLAAVMHQVQIGAVWLMCVLCGILSGTFTAYHLYLIWAGTTTNETNKWADWRDDIRDGMIFKAELEEAEMEMGEWPKTSRLCLFRVKDGNTQDLPRGLLWFRVKNLTELDNVYDLGAWRNLLDVLFPGELVDTR